MSHQNEGTAVPGQNGAPGTEHKHQSWLGHIVEEAREKFDELVEEAQNSMNDGGFSALGNGQTNVVHDHHHNHDNQPEAAAAPQPQPAVAQTTDAKPAEHHQSWLGHIVEEVREKFDELVEEAQNSMNDGGFSALGNGETNVVHDHHRDHDNAGK